MKRFKRITVSMIASIAILAVVPIAAQAEWKVVMVGGIHREVIMQLIGQKLMDNGIILIPMDI